MGAGCLNGRFARAMVTLAGFFGLVAAGSPQLGPGAHVTILVTVLASAKMPLVDLTAKDFTVTAHREECTVLGAEHATTPLSVQLLVDNTRPAIGAFPATQDVRSGLQAFVKALRAGNPNVEIAMTEFAGAATPTVAFGAPPQALDDAIRRFASAPQTAGVLLEALGDAGRAIGSRPESRRAIVSVDLASPDPTSDVGLDQVEASVFHSGATFWAVSVAGSDTAETPSRDAVLNGLTVQTGGTRSSIIAATGLTEQLKAIANSLSSQYLVQLAAPADGDLSHLAITTDRGVKAFSSVNIQVSGSGQQLSAMR